MDRGRCSLCDRCDDLEPARFYLPLAGGSYNFLKEGYGPKWGKLMSFLFVWQTMIQAPLVIASAAIGFAQYAGYIVHLNDWQSKFVSGGLVILIIVLLYRKIEAIGKISVLLWMGVCCNGMDHRQRYFARAFFRAGTKHQQRIKT
jgi:hypothetical protein